MYRNIADYGLIGDMRTAALVSRDGSIDYCSLPWLDSPTVFAALLDDEKGGFFSIRPVKEHTSNREYVPETNILSCTFTTDGGTAELIDFMPVEQSMPTQRPQGIHRCVRSLDGLMEFELSFAPRPGYGLLIPLITKVGQVFVATAGDYRLYLLCPGLSFRAEGIGSDTLKLTFTLAAGEEAHIDLLAEEPSEMPACPFESTKSYWEEWMRFCMGERCIWLGEFTPLVHRSLLALKLLTVQPTGAIAAAPTTSLPESIGGERNWDYRFTWLRDASFTLKALFALGHVSEADSFIHWLHATYRRHGSRHLQIMYSIQGKQALVEQTLTHLKGYRNSKPVRTGNAAFGQNQWDIYGEVMDAALRLSDYAGKIDEELWPFFRDICEMACENWRKPDDGIWEVRNGPHHFVYSKVMCWVALDRGITIARRFGFDAPLDRWARERDTIKTDVLDHGFSPQRNSFVQRYGSDQLDACLLLLPLVNFLPVSDSRVQGTIEACRSQLMQDGFVRRYLAEDGLEGREGGFVLCNFWLIECLALSGRIEEAELLLASTMRAANELGLFAEEYDPWQGEMLGNFPQAFSHIGYINAVAALLAGRAPAEMPDTELSLMQWLQRLVPLRITLNADFGGIGLPAARIDIELKRSLGRLQGAFFDTRTGRVNYAAMKRSDSFGQYQRLAADLRRFGPEAFVTDQQKKAFWINIYNILIIHGVIALDIRRSVLEIVNFFGRIGYDIGGTIFSPDDIEHGILRKNRPHPAFPVRPFGSGDPRLRFCVEEFDARIHFALVCASSSCPPIEFYDAEKIDGQLDIAARSFINRRGLELDLDKGELRLSRIFEWYAGDFGSSQEEVLGFVLRFAGKEVCDAIAERRHTPLRIRYLPYNWDLNRSLVHL
jgi:GH15 family glucan-1,4-alpha-glucosidase